MAEAAARAPLYIRMHERDNVAIVANDGGLPAGTVFAVRPDAGRQGAAGAQGRAGRPRRRRRGAALQRRHRPRRAGHRRPAAGCTSGCCEMPDGARRSTGLPIATVQPAAAAAARGLHLRGLPQRRRLGRHAQHPGDHDHRAVRGRRGRLRGAAHQGRAAAAYPERRRRGRPGAQLRLRRGDRRARRGRSRSARCATSA